MKQSKIRVSIGDLEVQKKHRLKVYNTTLSAQLELFSCSGKAIDFFNDGRKDVILGISKQESRISNRLHVSGCLAFIDYGAP